MFFIWPIYTTTTTTTTTAFKMLRQKIRPIYNATKFYRVVLIRARRTLGELVKYSLKDLLQNPSEKIILKDLVPKILQQNFFDYLTFQILQKISLWRVWPLSMTRTYKTSWIALGGLYSVVKWLVVKNVHE